jgi:hypothetical protein
MAIVGCVQSVLLPNVPLLKMMRFWLDGKNEAAGAAVAAALAVE